MGLFLAIQAALLASKKAAPLFRDAVELANTVGKDVTSHASAANTLTDALSVLEKAFADATGIS